VATEFIDVDRYMSDTFTVDIDTPYERFMEYSDEFIELLQDLQVWAGGIREVWIRRSASGNVHLMVKMRSRHDFIELVMFRAFLNDDPIRVRSDLVKLLKGQFSVFGQLWEGKIVIRNGKAEYRKAGRWRNFFDESARYQQKLIKRLYKSHDR